MLKEGVKVRGEKFTIVEWLNGDLAWQWHVTGAGSSAGLFFSSTMDANRNLMRMAAGLPPVKGDDAPKALDGPEELVEIDGSVNLTPGIVGDVFVRWRPVEARRKAVRKAELALRSVEEKAAALAQPEQQLGRDDSSPLSGVLAPSVTFQAFMSAQLEVIGAHATLEVAQDALSAEVEAEAEDYEKAKARVITLQTASLNAAVVRADLLVDAARLAGIAGKLQAAVTNAERAKQSADKRRVDLQTAQSQGEGSSTAPLRVYYLA